MLKTLMIFTIVAAFVLVLNGTGDAGKLAKGLYAIFHTNR